MKKKLFFVLTILIIFALFVVKFVNVKEIYINYILETSSYSYLPKEIKDEVKSEYLENGRLILTEKNKKTNSPYINPKYVEYISMSSEEQKDINIVPELMTIDYMSQEVNASSIPSTYNLKNVGGKSYITGLKSQGDLGICWAFSTIESVESNLLVKTAQTYELSPRQVDYGTSSNGINNFVGFLGTRPLKSGGTVADAFIFYASGLSLTKSSWDSDKSVNYSSSSSKKLNLSDVYNFNNSVYELNSTKVISAVGSGASSDNKSNFISNIKSNIMTYGGPSIASVSPVSNDPNYSNCSYKDSSTGYYIMRINSTCTGEGHALQVIGWSDSVSYKYCVYNNKEYTYNSSSTACTKGKVNSGKGAWILRNSWGSSYSYFYYTYDSSYNNSFYFVTDVTSMKNRTWKNVYSNSFNSDIGGPSSYDKITNKKEKLEKIKVYVISNTGSLNFYAKQSSEKSATLLATKSINGPGIYTVDVSSKNYYITESFDITISGDPYYYGDSVFAFTSNVDNTEEIKTKDIIIYSTSNKKVNLYTNTRNISSGESITYKLYDEKGNAVSTTLYSITGERKVAYNMVDAVLTVKDSLPAGKYVLKSTHNKTESSSIVSIVHGKGSIDDPYIIKNATDLYNISKNMSAYYALGNDIDLSKETSPGGSFYNGGKGWIPIGNDTSSFYGSLDGRGYSIKGLNSSNEISSLFYSIGLDYNYEDDAYIKNINFVDFKLNGTYSAPLAYKIKNSKALTIENISVINCSIKGSYVASLANNVSLIFEGNNINIKNIFTSSELTNTSSYVNSGVFIGKIVPEKMSIVNMDNLESISILNGKIAEILGGVEFYDEAYVNINNTILNNYYPQVQKNNYLILGTNTDYKLISVKNVFGTSFDYVSTDSSYNSTNVKKYNVLELKNKSIYSDWSKFDESFEIKSVDSITRIPILKNAINKFDYTKISNSSLSIEKGTGKNIYDYITPKNNIAKNITFEVKDKDILGISDDGLIRGFKNGLTTIKIISNYDGFEKEISVNVTGDKSYVYFETNGGSKIDNIPIEKGKTIAKPKDPVKDHNTFIGWYKDPEFKNEFDFNTTLETDLVLYAKWDVEKFVISYDANGGENAPKDQIKNYGEYITLSNQIPLREGYKFLGWSTSNTLTYAEYKATDRYTEEKSIKLYAIWEVEKFTINIELDNNISSINYGDCNEGKYYSTTKNVIIKDVPYGTKYCFWASAKSDYETEYSNGGKMLKVDIKDNYTFKPVAKLIYYDIPIEVGKGIEGVYYKVGNDDYKYTTKNITLNVVTKMPLQFYAIPKDNYTYINYTKDSPYYVNSRSGLSFKPEGYPNKYVLHIEIKDGVNSIYYKVNDSNYYNSTSSSKDIIVDYGTKFYLYTNIDYQYTLNDYYNEETAYSGVVSKDFSFSPTPEHKKYTITYHADDATNVPKPELKNTSKYEYISSEIPEKDGYVFEGWSTNKGSSYANYKIGGSIINSSDMDLYAVWSIDTYDNQLRLIVNKGISRIYYGTSSNPGNFVTYTTILSVPKDSTYYVYAVSENGYTYNEYSSDNVYSLLVNENKEYSPVAIPDKFTIKYDANGGKNAPSNQIKEYKEDLHITNDIPTNDVKYEFLGWSTKKDATYEEYKPGDVINSNKDITLYAVWSIKKVRLTIRYGEGVDWVTFKEGIDGQFYSSYTDRVVETDYGTDIYLFAILSKGYLYDYYDKEHLLKITLTEDYVYRPNVTLQKLKINYFLNDGTDTKIEKEKYYSINYLIEGELFTPPINAEFKEWNTKSDGTGVSYKKDDIYASTLDLNLYAIWDYQNYEIKDYAMNEYDGKLEEGIPRKRLTKIGVETSVSNYLEHFSGAGFTFKVFSLKGIELKGDDLISTGSITKVYKGNQLFDEMINIIKGDVNCDGAISPLDYVIIRSHINETDIIKIDYIYNAADYTDDNNVSPIDYVQVREYIREKDY